MKSNKTVTAGVVACMLAAAAWACGDKTSVEQADVSPEDNLAQSSQRTGCIQGVVINGLTGERIALPEANEANQRAGKGVTVRVRDTLIPSTDMALALPENTAMKGEYTLCGVPVEDDFPVYAQVDGYQPFGAKVRISSTVPQLTTDATADLQKPLPTRIVNLRLFPVGLQTKDLRFVVLYGALPVKDATVQLKPADGNALVAATDDFLAPSNGALMAVNAVTDANGEAAFPAAQLVLGGAYTYVVLPPAGADRTVHKGNLTIGLLDGRGEQDAYRIVVNLAHTSAAPRVVSESNEPQKDGIKTCVFNRPVELVPGTLDQVMATVTGSVEAIIKPAVAGNNASESAKVTLSSDGLTLTLAPLWEKNPDLAKEPTLAVQYSGLVVRPIDAPGVDDHLTVAEQCKLAVNLAE